MVLIVPLGCEEIKWHVRRCLHEVTSILCLPLQRARCSQWGWHLTWCRFTKGSFYMLYCSLLYLHQAPTWVLRFPSKPSPASGNTKGSSCYPGTTRGCQMFPLCFWGQARQLLNHLATVKTRQVKTSPDSSWETLCCPVSAKPLAFHQHWQESYLLCYFIYRNKIRLKLSEIMSICLVFSVWENRVGQHYQMHSKQTDWSHSCRSET